MFHNKKGSFKINEHLFHSSGNKNNNTSIDV